MIYMLSTCYIDIYISVSLIQSVILRNSKDV